MEGLLASPVRGGTGGGGSGGSTGGGGGSTAGVGGMLDMLGGKFAMLVEELEGMPELAGIGGGGINAMDVGGTNCKGATGF